MVAPPPIKQSIPAPPPPGQVPLPPAPPARDEGEPFTVGTWGGAPQYTCNYCPESFADHDAATAEMAAWLHYRDWHNRREPDGSVSRQRRALSVDEVTAIREMTRG